MTDHATVSLVQANLTLPSTTTQIGISLVMLLALWPTRRRAVAVLNRWGLRGPTELDPDAAQADLKRRRLAYPGLYLALTLAASPWRPAPALALAVLLAAILLAGAIDWQHGRAAAPAGTSSTPLPGTRRRARAPWRSSPLAGGAGRGATRPSRRGRTGGPLRGGLALTVAILMAAAGVPAERGGARRPGRPGVGARWCAGHLPRNPRGAGL